MSPNPVDPSGSVFTAGTVRSESWGSGSKRYFGRGIVTATENVLACPRTCAISGTQVSCSRSCRMLDIGALA
jgi:hypothetical protein